MLGAGARRKPVIKRTNAVTARCCERVVIATDDDVVARASADNTDAVDVVDAVDADADVCE